MEQFNVHEAKTRLSELLQRVEQGEEFLLARAGKPIARLTRLEETNVRQPGFLKFEFDKGLFDSADSEIQQLFEDSKVFPE
ncbi:MAG: type II toxin-antitoxin system Phd/YefM family antitoxin [Candidatus Eremiobacteraeota bacterium]|nr:type II toxin-antitoxin system Phd/YefM family antitoxin [Candidatus Eremiobacteraeota bacterium]